MRQLFLDSKRTSEDALDLIYKIYYNYNCGDTEDLCDKILSLMKFDLY